MIIDTAVFGPVDVNPQDIFTVPEGLFGFDGIHSYALISKQDEDVVLHWFQATEQTTPCFVVFDPFEIVDGYRPEMEAGDLRALDCKSLKELQLFVIAVVPEDVNQATVNLKSPIALNRKAGLARQVILRNLDYPVRFSLGE